MMEVFLNRAPMSPLDDWSAYRFLMCHFCARVSRQPGPVSPAAPCSKKRDSVRACCSWQPRAQASEEEMGSEKEKTGYL